MQYPLKDKTYHRHGKMRQNDKLYLSQQHLQSSSACGLNSNWSIKTIAGVFRVQFLGMFFMDSCCQQWMNTWPYMYNSNFFFIKVILHSLSLIYMYIGLYYLYYKEWSHLVFSSSHIFCKLRLIKLLSLFSSTSSLPSLFSLIFSCFCFSFLFYCLLHIW